MSEKVIVAKHSSEEGTYTSYVIGFVSSIVLTIIAYFLVVNRTISNRWALTIVIGFLAIIQCIVQLRLFLHLGSEAKPKLRLLVFGFMLTVVLILVGGSIWIMYNLNNRMTTPREINTYMQKQDDGGL
jgi:cytochrome o ubiquinol oxidase operon protein cyoD